MPFSKEEIDRRSSYNLKMVQLPILKKNNFGKYIVEFDRSFANQHKSLYIMKKEYFHIVFDYSSQTLIQVCDDGGFMPLYIALNTHQYDQNYYSGVFSKTDDLKQIQLYWGGFGSLLIESTLQKNNIYYNFAQFMQCYEDKDQLCCILNFAAKKNRAFDTIESKSYSVRNDYQVFLNDLSTSSADQFYIYKPAYGRQGKNITIFNKNSQFSQQLKNEQHKFQDPAEIQEYINNPFLVNGQKFDFRIYVLMTGMKPLQVYVYKEGIVRFASQKYQPATEENCDKQYIHLTNSAINDGHEVDKSWPATWKLTDFLKYCEDHASDLTSGKYKDNSNELSNHIYSEIHKIVKLTNLAVQRALPDELVNSMTDHQFLLQGYDIMMTDQLEAKLIEVNMYPSTEPYTRADCEIKYPLLVDVFNLIGMQFTKKGDQFVIKETVNFSKGSNNAAENVLMLCNSVENNSKTIDNEVIEKMEGEMSRLGNFDMVLPSAKEEDYHLNSRATQLDLLCCKHLQERLNHNTKE